MASNPTPEWEPGVLIEHNGIPMTVERVEYDEWLGEQVVILYCSDNRCVIVSERTKRSTHEAHA
jgi:hypothetical protein